MPEIIPNRKEAIERGLKRYFTGKPCKRGHLTERMASNGMCLKCQALRSRRNYRKNIQYFKAYGKIYNAKEENRVRSRALEREKRRQNPELYNKRRRRRQQAKPDSILAEERAKRRARAAERRSETRKRDRLRYQSATRREWRIKNQEKISERNKKRHKLEYYHGPSNPTGEKQWLSKAKATLRNFHRELKNRLQEQQRSSPRAT